MRPAALWPRIAYVIIFLMKTIRIWLPLLVVFMIQGILSSETPTLCCNDGEFSLIKAWYSDTGPYGESWSLTLTSKGDVLLSMYSSSPSGSAIAEFDIGKDGVEKDSEGSEGI